MTATPTDAGLLTAILANPADDGPRMILADWLDENGQTERAEFCRVQCELAKLGPCESECKNRIDYECTPCRLRRRERELWCPPLNRDMIKASKLATLILPGMDEPTPGIYLAWGIVRRGFVAEVTLPTLALVGWPYERCYRGNHAPAPEWQRDCLACAGTGRVPGIAADLFRTQPITRVTMSDREPQHYSDDAYGWSKTRPGQSFHLPDELYDRLMGYEAYGPWRDYPTRAAALDALSRACAQWGREQAGLEPLKK